MDLEYIRFLELLDGAPCQLFDNEDDHQEKDFDDIHGYNEMMKCT